MTDSPLATVKALVKDAFKGNVSALARALGLTPQTVGAVLRKGSRVPASWCVKLERLSNGRISRHDLRPDLYPREDT